MGAVFHFCVHQGGGRRRIEVEEPTFPALHQAADSASKEAQASLLSSHRLNNILLVSAALAAGIGDSVEMAMVSLVLFLGLLGLYIHSQHNDLQGKWYQARALAESIKTASWRFMMSADPFHGDEGTAKESFRQLLSELLHQNRGIADYLCGDVSTKDQITPEMLATRQLPFEEEREQYLRYRISDQLEWYAKKSTANRSAAKQWFTGLCSVYGLAIIFLIFRIAEQDIPAFPVDVLAVAAGCMISWVQVKRFSELASAYGLTSHEIGIIKSRFDGVTDSAELSRFVSDAENAFSREHTQWAARRDHAA